MKRENNKLLSPLLEETLRHLKPKRSGRTIGNYRSSINKAKAFAGAGWERMGVEDVTRKWTDDFTCWLEKCHGDKPQTVNFYLRTFRALYVHALVRSTSGTDGKPFGGCHPCGSFPSRRALKREEVRRLLSPELRRRLPGHRRQALDILVFILYARGMVFKDVYGLTWRMVADGHIRYRRSKTGVPVEVEVVPELEEIMCRHHREGSPFVFPFLHKPRAGCPEKELPEESALRRVNRSAREIGRMVGLTVPLTTYVLRHTWATLMLEDGNPVELISQCMGHTSIRTTQIYLSRISSGKADSAVNGMYDRMLRKSGHRKKDRDVPPGRKDVPPRVPRPPKNKKCPFLSKKETSPSCHASTVLFFVAKVYISYVCCKYSSAFLSYPPDISFLLPFLHSL